MRFRFLFSSLCCCTFHEMNTMKRKKDKTYGTIDIGKHTNIHTHQHCVFTKLGIS